MNTNAPTEEFLRQMREKGWVTFDRVLEDSLIDDLKTELPKAYEAARAVQQRNGVGDETGDTVNHLVTHGGSFLRLLEHDLLSKYLSAFFGSKYILNAFGGITNKKKTRAYLSRIHRDIRSSSGDLNLMLNMLIKLDDFTADNGATWVLTGSQLRSEEPSEQEFFENAEQILGSKGSITVWNSNLWHAAGRNRTDQPRLALSLLYSKPFIKQQLDYPRVLGYEFLESASPRLKQIVGYYARTPTNLDEWYQPRERRFYRSDQG